MSDSEVLKEVCAPVIGVAPGHRGTYGAHLQEWDGVRELKLKILSFMIFNIHHNICTLHTLCHFSESSLFKGKGARNASSHQTKNLRNDPFKTHLLYKELVLPLILIYCDIELKLWDGDFLLVKSFSTYVQFTIIKTGCIKIASAWTLLLSLGHLDLKGFI